MHKLLGIGTSCLQSVVRFFILKIALFSNSFFFKRIAMFNYTYKTLKILGILNHKYLLIHEFRINV
jgi:hypothetical protein